MNKNAIATLTTAFKNVEAKNFKLNVQKNQKKNNTVKAAKKTYWGNWDVVHAGMELANRDTKGMYKNIRKYLKSLYAEMTPAQFDMHHVAYMKNRLQYADEKNASVRFTKNLTMRVELAKKILNGSII